VQALIDGVIDGVRKKIAAIFPDIVEEEIRDIYVEAHDAMATIGDAVTGKGDVGEEDAEDAA